ncbi:MAG: DsbA family protein [Alphaproteobacteria bacterium]|nr:DsbA family protein [Alphaproteobacteria bacterium]
MSIVGKYQEHITLYLDFTCPWCYIGWHNLLQAVGNISADKLLPQLHYRCYELNAEIEEPLTLADYMAERFGDKASANEWMRVVTQAGIDSGIDVNFDNIKYVFNTRLLHRMLQALRHRERQLHCFLDSAFYHIILQGRVLDNEEAIETYTGFNYHKVISDKTEDAWDRLIEQDLLHGSNAGVTGIPCYNFGRDYSLFGAQSQKGYEAMLDLLYETATTSQQDNRFGTLLKQQQY